MFSFLKKKIIIPHVRLTGVIGAAGRFKQGMDLAGQKVILKKAFSFKKISHVAISINSPGGSPVQSHLIYSYIKQLAKEKKIKVIYSITPIKNSNIYNYISKDCFEETKINENVKSYELKFCNDLNFF